MQYAIVNSAKLRFSYLDEKKSVPTIAVEMGTNETKIRRALKFLGVPIRSYAEAQSVAISQGIAKHPTKGKKLSKETINNISAQRSKAWLDLPEDEKQKFRDLKKEQWNNMTESAKENLRSAAYAAIRESAEIGSKTERYVSAALEEEGYGVIIHARNLIQSQALEVDMFVPDLKTAIEIDGPSHWLPVWGDDKLKKQQSADTAKQGLLLANGYAIIRVRQIDKSMSVKRMKDVYDLILSELRKIEVEFPPVGKRLIELEIKDGVTRRIG
jgi:very-short-patch-repair endonuclease